MPFTEAQKKAIDLRGANILVSASAGSGKTSVLVERLCQLVTHDKISINHILAMTLINWHYWKPPRFVRLIVFVYRLFKIITIKYQFL